jgi:hypothetical protein
MQGVIILSLKKPAYALGAFNLALSIKHFNPSINITLVSDGEHKRHYRQEHYEVFDKIKDINLCDYIDFDGSFQPALAKININRYSDYKQTLYIDADSLVLQDLQPLFDKLKGNKFKSNVIEGYTQWTDEETFKSFFGVDFGLTINSSWFYFEDKKAFDQANKYYSKSFPVDKIAPKWGGTYPDELFFNASITKLKIDPKVDFDVMFFGNAIDKRTYSEIEKDFYGFTLYGGQRTVRDIYITWYDRLCFKFCKNKGIEHRFKAHGILTGKHVLNK